MISLNPRLAGMAPHPFTELDRARRRAIGDGARLIDFSVGDPHEATDPAIRASLVDAVEERSRYPKADGLPEGHGVVVAPGSFFGEAGEGYFRLALVPTLAECRLAVDLLDAVL